MKLNHHLDGDGLAARRLALVHEAVGALACGVGVGVRVRVRVRVGTLAYGVREG